jgi:hypothetical protein
MVIVWFRLRGPTIPALKRVFYRRKYNGDGGSFSARGDTEKGVVHYTGPGGGLYTGPGGGLYTGPCNDHYYSIIPPWDIFIQELLKRGLKNYVDIIFKYYKYGIEKQTYFAFNNTGRRDNMAIYVANAPGEDYDPEHPSGYDSWIDYWNQSRYPENDKVAGKCRGCGKKQKTLMEVMWNIV